MSEYYFYGLAALMYLTTSWTFAAIRWFHTCRAPKERRRYIWPDRKLQVLLYCCATVLLPYVSLTFSQRFGSFANYVNSLRLAHYEQYLTDHPNETKEAAAIASGFSSYNAYYRAKQKQSYMRRQSS